MANIMAVVAVLEIQADMQAVTAPKANRMRVGLLPTQPSDSAAKASRRSSPCRKMARARMNEPMKRNMIGSANGANTSLAVATRKTTHSDAPTSAVTGMASASVIHNVTTAANTAARRCASGESDGSSACQTAANAIGASTSPARTRQRSNCRSRELRGSTVVGGTIQSRRRFLKKLTVES
jgi:hypothetical protein